MNIELKDILIIVPVAAILVDWLRIKFDKWKKENEQRQAFKEVRYKAIIILMLAALDFDKNKASLHAHGRIDLNELKDLLDELDIEWKNMMLYANDVVFRNLGGFVKTPTLDLFWKTALAMRKDLYGIKTKLSLDEILQKNK